MSESKQNFDNKGEENDLSARISAVKNNINNIEEKNAQKAKENKSEVRSRSDDRPDISFSKAAAPTVKRTASSGKATGANKSAQNKPAQPKQAAEQKKTQVTPAKKTPDNQQAQSKKIAVRKDTSKESNAKPAVKDEKIKSESKAVSKNSAKSKSDSAAKDKPAAKPASADAEKGGKKKKFTKKQGLTIAALIIALLAVLLLIIFLIFNHYYNLLDKEKSNISNSTPLTYSDVDYSRSDTMDKAAEDEKLKELAANAEKISDEEVMNILLIGEDLRDTEGVTTGGNTDVMMIISVNTKDKTITLTSIMRDCYVYIPGHYSTRINAAYWLGGVDLTEETIETYMNVEIDRYVLVNFTTFIDIVDSLGGLDLYVSDEEANGYEGADPDGDNTRGMQNPLDEQNKYLGNKKGTDYLESGGNVHLNGNQALAYARLRHVGNSDYERTERQRKVIKEIIKKSRDLSLVEMDSLANEILPQIETDITKAEAAQLLIDMLDYRNYTLQEYRVPADGTFSNQVISGMDVLSVDFYANAESFQELVYGSIEIKDDDEDEDTGWTE